MITPTSIPATFHRLTPEDEARFGHPELIELSPPPTDDPIAARKREQWIEWRAASYPADRHSEYLFRPDVDGDDGPKILLSAVLRLPESVETYLARVPAKRRYDLRGMKARRRGYTARQIDPRAESKGIWEVIHSTTVRQGRAVAPMFAERPPDYAFPGYEPCRDPRYRDICCGVFAEDGSLAAYLLGKRVGEHVQYDEIMGHADRLGDDVMYLLHHEFLRQCAAAESPPAILNYGPWYSGADPYSPDGGLNRWKRKVGFRPAWMILASW